MSFPIAEDSDRGDAAEILYRNFRVYRHSVTLTP